MKRILQALFFCFLVSGALNGQEKALIPSPGHVSPGEGEFVITPVLKIVAPASLRSMAELFAESSEDLFGLKPVVSGKGGSSGNIILKVDEKTGSPEGYELRIRPTGIEVRAAAAPGIYYGLQTIRQLLIASGSKSIKAQTISDSPRFAWRGVMLDVSRTFMPVNLVKRYIELFSEYKLNVLHLHLTDDQGWRVEIKRYPLLTSVGSKFDAKYNCMGGYYSQDDILELVKYAQQRNITIVPEIELPGHASAALTSYPWLSCSGSGPGIHTFFEGPSVHKEIFCAGKPEVYEFIFNVLDELITLFPSEYIHIGGDEAPKEEWKNCPLCQKTMKENDLVNEEELQSYFVKRIGEHLRNRHRILIGWDEIYDGGKLKGDEILMFWRGWKADSVSKAAAKGFRIIATPTTHCYFDYDYGNIDTRKIFGYDPVPAGATAEVAGRYIGVQANFWSHIDRSEYNIDKQLFPRLLGLAEAAWSSPENRNWETFRVAANRNVRYLKEHQTNVFEDISLK